MGLSRWHTLVAALWAGITCGFLYTYGTFGTALKDKFDLGTQSSTISTAQVAIGLITFTSGLLTDRIGVGPTLLVGAAVNTGSWLVFGAIANGFFTVPAPVVWFSLLACCATWGGACVTAAVFTVLAKNFVGQSAAPIGIAKAWVGVAAGVATTVYVGFFPTSDESPERLGYIWFLSAACFLGVALAAPMLKLLAEPASGDDLCIPNQWRYHLLTANTLVLIATTALASLLHDSMNSTERAVLSSAILVIVALPGLLLLPGGGRRRGDGAGGALLGAEAQVVLGAGRPSGGAVRGAGAVSRSPWASGPGKMLKRADSWLLWLVIFSLQSGGILLTTNMGNIAQSRGGGNTDAAEATAMFSCAQSLGRLFSGRLSDIAVRRRIPRPFCFVALTAIMCAAHAMLCMPGRGAFFAGTIFAGFAFGSMYPIMIVTIGELFGTERIASNYMVFDGCPGAVSSIAVGKYFAVAVYEANVPAGSDKCFGDGCYRMTFVAVAGLQLIAGSCAVALAMRSRIVYTASIFDPGPTNGALPSPADGASAPPLGTGKAENA